MKNDADYGMKSRESSEKEFFLRGMNFLYIGNLCIKSLQDEAIYASLFLIVKCFITFHILYLFFVLFLL